MCFTERVTLIMMLVTLGTALLLHAKGCGFRRYQIFYVFFLMERLQYVQYQERPPTLGGLNVLDQCDNPINQWSTRLAYLHVCFQCVSVNYYAFAWEPNQDVVKLVIRLCTLGGVLMMLRLPLFGVNEFLHEKFAFLGQEFPNASWGGTPEGCGLTALCGPQLCTKTGAAHMRWELPLLPPTYFLGGPVMHFFMFFGPIILAPGFYHKERVGIVLVSLFMGPLLAMAWTYKKAGLAYRFEWPTLWCAYASSLCLLAIIYEFAIFGGGRGDENPNEMGSMANRLYTRKVEDGTLWDQRKVLAWSKDVIDDDKNMNGNGRVYETRSRAQKKLV